MTETAPTRPLHSLATRCDAILELIDDVLASCGRADRRGRDDPARSG